MLKALGPAASCSLQNTVTEAVAVCVCLGSHGDMHDATGPVVYPHGVCTASGPQEQPPEAASRPALGTHLYALSLMPWRGRLECHRPNVPLSFPSVHRKPGMRLSLKPQPSGSGWSQKTWTTGIILMLNAHPLDLFPEEETEGQRG